MEEGEKGGRPFLQLGLQLRFQSLDLMQIIHSLEIDELKWIDV